MFSLEYGADSREKSKMATETFKSTTSTNTANSNRWRIQKCFEAREKVSASRFHVVFSFVSNEIMNELKLTE